VDPPILDTLALFLDRTNHLLNRRVKVVGPPFIRANDQVFCVVSDGANGVSHGVEVPSLNVSITSGTVKVVVAQAARAC
jgi:hypothetical protein